MQTNPVREFAFDGVDLQDVDQELGQLEGAGFQFLEARFLAEIVVVASSAAEEVIIVVQRFDMAELHRRSDDATRARFDCRRYSYAVAR